MWVFEIDLISVWGIEFDLISLSGWELTSFFCGGRKIIGFRVWIEIHLVVSGRRNGLDFRLGIELT